MSIDWRKRDTPTPVLLAVALLAIYAGCAGFVATAEKSLLIGSTAVTAAVAAVAAATLKPWSRYLVYVLTVALLGKLGYSIYSALVAGYFDRFDSRGAALWSLLPTGVMTALFLLAGWIVHRQFGGVSKPPAHVP